VLVDGQIASPKGMAVLGKYLYWIDKEHMLISRHVPRKYQITGLEGKISWVISNFILQLGYFLS
jgi:hypothetical protein